MFKTNLDAMSFALACLTWTAGSASAQSVNITAVKSDKPNTINIRFTERAAYLKDAAALDDKVKVELIDGDARTPLNLKKVDVSADEITEEVLKEVPKPDFAHPELIGTFVVSGVRVTLADAYPAQGKVSISIPGGVIWDWDGRELVARKGATVDVTDTRAGSITSVDELSASLDQTRKDQRFTIQGGDRDGVISFHGAKHLTGLGSGKLDFQASIEGSLTLDDTRRFDYFNDLEVSVDGYTTFGAEKLRYAEFGLHYTFDADQKLDNADNVLGLKFATVIRDPVTGVLNDLLVPKDTAGGYPLWVLRADYVKEALEDSTTAGTKPDTSDGDVRATANIDWSVPIGRDMGWDFLPQLGTIDKLDLDCAYEATWDFDESEYLDNLKLSLRFATRAKEGETSTAFDITWAKGEEGPIFNDVEALFAGITLSR